MPKVIPNLHHATTIIASSNDDCAILTDHTLRCWGYNGAGEIGNSTTEQPDGPVAPLGTTADAFLGGPVGSRWAARPW